MNLDELQRRWDAHDHQLTSSLHLHTQLARTLMKDRGATALRPLARWLAIELAMGGSVAIWLGSFVARVLGDPRYAVTAAVLLVGLIVLLALAVHQLAAIRALDWTAPVLGLQSRLETLRVERLRTARAVLMLGPLLWLPALAVVVRGTLGIDLLAADHVWLVANVLFGIAVLAVSWWVSHRYADQLARSGVIRQLARDLAGSNIHAALDALAAVREMERVTTDPARVDS